MLNSVYYLSHCAAVLNPQQYVDLNYAAKQLYNFTVDQSEVVNFYSSFNAQGVSSLFNFNTYPASNPYWWIINPLTDVDVCKYVLQKSAEYQAKNSGNLPYYSVIGTWLREYNWCHNPSCSRVEMDGGRHWVWDKVCCQSIDNPIIANEASINCSPIVDSCYSIPDQIGCNAQNYIKTTNGVTYFSTSFSSRISAYHASLAKTKQLPKLVRSQWSAAVSSLSNLGYTIDGVGVWSNDSSTMVLKTFNASTLNFLLISPKGVKVFYSKVSTPRSYGEWATALYSNDTATQVAVSRWFQSFSCNGETAVGLGIKLSRLLRYYGLTLNNN